MIYDEFNFIIEKIKKNYGQAAEKWFTIDRLDIYFSILKYYPLGSVMTLINEYICANAYVPKVTDLRTMLRNITSERDNVPIDFDCNLCDNSGFVSLFKKPYYQAFAFRCSCAHGKRYSKQIPEFTGPNEDFIIQDDYFDEMKRPQKQFYA